jgi:phosphoenolpyruvate-protein kinase (PTS system EI component)
VHAQDQVNDFRPDSRAPGGRAAVPEVPFFGTHRKRYLIVDRGVLFSEQFKAMLRSSGTKMIRTSIQAPNIKAFAERFVLSMKSE